MDFIALDLLRAVPVSRVLLFDASSLHVAFWLSQTHLTLSACPSMELSQYSLRFLACKRRRKVKYQQPALERCDNLGRVEEEVLPPTGSLSALAEVAGVDCWPRGAKGGSWDLAFEEDASGLRCCIEATRH